MDDLLSQIMALPVSQRLELVIEIIKSIQEEDSAHEKELEALQDQLKRGKVRYYRETEFWTEARKRRS